MDYSNNFFTTDAKSTHRPYTSDNNTRLNDSYLKKPQTAAERLRKVKQQMKQANQSYLEVLNQNHKIKRSVDKTNHISLIKRLEFLKIYANKKYKFQEKQLLQNSKKQSEKQLRISFQETKRKKLESELQYILLKNEEEESIIKKQMKAKRQKQVFKRQKQLKNEEIQREIESKYSEIKKGENEFLVRKSNIHTSLNMRSKHNYMEKMNHQLSLIKEYSNLMQEIKDFDVFDQAHPIQSNAALPQTQKVENTPDRIFVTSNTIDLT